MIDVASMSEEEKKKYGRIILDPVIWAETFLKNPDDPLENFKCNYVQKQILRTRSKRNAIRVHRRGGKCSLETDLIPLADGSRVMAKDLVGKTFNLLTLTDCGIKSVVAFADWNEIEDVYTIETESGRKITRNAQHPLFYAEITSTRCVPIIDVKEWTNLQDMKVGNLVAVPTSFPHEGTETLSDDEIKILAYLIGDGGIKQSGTIFTQQDNKQLHEFIEISSNLGCKVTAIKNSKYDYGVAGLGKGGPGSNPIRNILKNHNLTGKGSHDKFVPSEIFTSSRRQIALFLSRLYSTDGWASLHGKTYRGSNEIGYCSMSEQLARDIQDLLLRLGICSFVRNKVDVNAWIVEIRDSQEIVKFCNTIGIYGKEEAVEKILEDALRILNKPTKNGTKIIKDEDGLEWKIWKGKSGKNRKVQFTPWRYNKAPEGMRWEKVKSITYSGVKQTVAITVPEYNTYITNFYEHNTVSLSIYPLWVTTTRPNTEVLIIAPGQPQVDKIFENIRALMATSPLFDNRDEMIIRDKQNPQFIMFANGSKIKGFTTGGGKKDGTVLRGQGADVVIIDEAAYVEERALKALQAILVGDKYRKLKKDVTVFASSTPNGFRGHYYSWCMDYQDYPENNERYVPPQVRWNRIHIPVTENPEYTEEDLQIARTTCQTNTDWQTEWLADFPQEGAGVFIPADIEVANSGDWSYEPKRHGDRIRSMGVDWDKFQAGVNIAILEIEPASNKYNLIYREEFKRGEFTLSSSINRIVELNNIFQPNYIYVDRGYGECVRNDTSILTLRGFVPIKDIKIGDMVLSYDNDFHKVTGKLVNPEKKPVYEVIVKGQEPICISDIHPLMTYEQNTSSWKSILNLAVGDLVALQNLSYSSYIQEEGFYFDEHWFMPIKSIRYIGEEEGLVDIEVEDGDSFSGNGILLHNTQIELLHLYGKRNPMSSLDKKVKGFSFNQKIKIYDSSIKAHVDKTLKGFMIGNLVRLFEEHLLVFPKTDAEFSEQLFNYHIEAYNNDGSYKFSSDNEHIIDAVGLAAFALFQNTANPFVNRAPTVSYINKTPTPVPSKATMAKERQRARENPSVWNRQNTGINGYNFSRTSIFSRTNKSSEPFSRSKF